MVDYSFDTRVHYSQGDEVAICGLALRACSDDFVIRDDLDSFDSVPDDNRCIWCDSTLGG